MKSRMVLFVFCVFSSTLVRAEVTENSMKLIRKVYEKCAPKDEIMKCLKIQALKVVDRALNSRALTIIDGMTLVSEDTRRGRAYQEVPLNETKLEKLSSDEIDSMLVDNTAKFLDSHKLKVDLPKMVEEGRKKDKKDHHALMWALAIKGSFLAMAYKGIAIMAGTALIVGKMALLLAAILGLKKLVSHGHEKTTFEIVKHPKYSEAHTHSNSYEEEGQYRRSFDSDFEFGMKTTEPYRGYIPSE